MTTPIRMYGVPDLAGFGGADGVGVETMGGGEVMAVMGAAAALAGTDVVGAFWRAMFSVSAEKV